MEHILRDIKLSKLTDTPLVGDADKLVKFWNELWTDMKVVIDPKKGEIKCWKDGYDCYYFSQNKKHGYFWCDNYKVWSFFEGELRLEYSETQKLIQYMVCETLNYNIGTFIGYLTDGLNMVCETLNCNIGTPGGYQGKLYIKVREA